MKKQKNPKLKTGDRVILVFMTGEDLSIGTKGKVLSVSSAPSFGDSPDYQYEMEWYDDDGNVFSKLSLIPDADSWMFDPEFKQNDLTEQENTDFDKLINRFDWVTLFKKSDLKYILEYLEVIRQLGVVNMFQSSQFLGQTRDYLKKYFDLYRMKRDLDDNKEELVKKMMDMSENVRNIMISAAITDLERNNKEITGRSATNRVNKLASELVKEFMVQKR